MAVRTTCSNCKKSFSAQDEYLGKKVKCPTCGVRVHLISADEAAARQQWEDEQKRRIELIERMSQTPAPAGGNGKSYTVEYGTGVEPVRNFNPGAMTRFRKLRALSRFLLLTAYLLFGVVLVGAGLTVLLFRQGWIPSWELLVLAEIGWGLLLLFNFCLFKFLGEMAWLLADLGDHQIDVRNLLMDIREDSDRWLLSRADRPTNVAPKTKARQAN